MSPFEFLEARDDKRCSGQAKEEQDAAVEAELAQEQRLQGAVEAGLAEARQRAGESRAPPSMPSPVAAAHAPTSSPDAGPAASKPPEVRRGGHGSAAEAGSNGAAARGEAGDAAADAGRNRASEVLSGGALEGAQTGEGR